MQNRLSKFYTAVGETQYKQRETIKAEFKDKSPSSMEMENTFKAILNEELTKLSRRIEDLETGESKVLPIPLLTVNSDLDDAKKTINYIINFINQGVRHEY